MWVRSTSELWTRSATRYRRIGPCRPLIGTGVPRGSLVGGLRRYPEFPQLVAGEWQPGGAALKPLCWWARQDLNLGPPVMSRMLCP